MLEYRTDFALKPVGIGGVFFWIEAKCEIIIWRADRAYRFAEGVIREVGFKTDVQIVVAEKTYAELGIDIKWRVACDDNVVIAEDGVSATAFNVVADCIGAVTIAVDDEGFGI